MDNQEAYTKKAIGFATYFGGPLVGGYLLFKNFKLFNEDDSARNTLIFSIIFFVVFFELFLLIPDPIREKIPRFVLPAIYTGIIYYIFKRFQDEKVSKFLQSGGHKASGWKIFGISVVGLLITLSYLMFRVMLIAPFNGKVMEFGSAGNKIYYDEEIAEKEVETLGQFLTDYGYFQSEVPQVVNFKLVDDKYEIHIFVDKNWWTDEDIVESLLSVQEQLSQKILSQKVEIIMIEDGIKGREEMSVNSAFQNLKTSDNAM